MATVYETGHAKNVSNLEEVISFCTGYGANYNPSKDSIKLENLNALLAQSKTILEDVTNKVTIFNNAISTRRTPFANFKPLSTKVINALSVTNATTKTIEDAKGINRKIQGTRATKKTTSTPDANNSSTPDDKTISSSQQSYNQQVEHFAKLISLLENEPTYTPNENELKVESLNALLTNMRNANTTIMNAYTDVSNSRIARDELFYTKDNNLYDVIQDVKKYIKSVFGATSPQYKQISGIKCTKGK